jgi:hypothetical protein
VPPHQTDRYFPAIVCNFHLIPPVHNKFPDCGHVVEVLGPALAQYIRCCLRGIIVVRAYVLGISSLPVSCFSLPRNLSVSAFILGLVTRTNSERHPPIHSLSPARVMRLDIRKDVTRQEALHPATEVPLPGAGFIGWR